MRPIESRNSVSPATSLFSWGIQILTLPCVWPGVSSTWNSALAEGNHRALFSGRVDIGPVRLRRSKPSRLDWQKVKLFEVAVIHVDRGTGQSAQLPRPGNVIDVAVSDDDGFDFELVPIEDLGDVFDICAGVDDDGFAALLIAEDGAITLQHPDGKNLVNHISMLAFWFAPA